MTEAPDVTSQESATQFVKWCVKQIGLGYHPDNPFAEYVEATGAPVFTADDAKHLDRLQERTFDFIDPYEVGMTEFKRLMGEESDPKKLAPKD